MNQRSETTLAILMFIGVLLGNVVIFTIVPFLSAPDLVGLRVAAGQALQLIGPEVSAQGASQPVPIHAFQIMLSYSAIATLCMTPWAMKEGLARIAYVVLAAAGIGAVLAEAGLFDTNTKIIVASLAAFVFAWRELRKAHAIRLYSYRALLEYGAFTLSFFSLGFLGDNFTLPMHTALNFITPIFATLATILILNERSHLHTWVALVMGIAGVLIITRPGMLPLSPGVAYVLGAALGFSLCGVVIKLLCATQSSQHIAFFMLAMTTLLALPLGLSHWVNPGLDGWFWLSLIGVIAYLQQVYVAKAISKVPFMVLIPINFVSLIFATLLSYVVYDRLIDEWTLAGAVLILISTLYNANRNQRLAARAG